MKRISKTLSVVLAVALLALAGCSTSEPVETVPEIVVPEAAPVVEAPAPAPVVEEAPAEEPQPEPEVVQEVVYRGSLSFFGYTLSYEAVAGEATVTYPDFITDEEIQMFFGYALGQNPALLSQVTYEITAPGQIVLTFPEEVTIDDAYYVVGIVGGYLQDFVTEYLGLDQPVEVVVEEPTPEVVEQMVYKGVLSFYGYELSYVASAGEADVTYPDFVTDEEVAMFFAYALGQYPDILSQVTYEITAPGQVVLTFPADATFDDAYYVVGLVANCLEDFVADYLGLDEQPAAAELPYGVAPIVKSDDGADDFYLYVVHTNDVHGRIVAGEDGSAGYANLATLLEMGRSVTDKVLVLDAGDVLHGTNLANVFKGESVGQILAMLGYDAVAPGNHDFNYGADQLKALAQMSEEIGGPKVLSANIVDENGYLVYQPYQVYSFNDFDVAVIGLTTPDTKTKSHPKNTEGLTFWDDSYAAVAQQAVDMANEVADYVIVLGHIGLDADGSSGITSDWICSNVDGIDLFVDGHSHTVLEQGMEVNGTLIVSSGEYLNNVGLVEIQVVDNEAVAETAMLIPAEDILDPASSELAAMVGISSITPDPEVTAFVDSLNAELDKRFSEVVATVPVDLDGARENVRTKQTNLSRLVTQAMTAETGADFSITNGGGIRASIAAGDVTLGMINDVLPFTNTVTVCEITGADVIAALEHGYSMLPETNGAFSQTDLKVVYSRFADPGSRVRRVLLPDGTPLDLNATYTVATNDFMAAGGDGYTMFGRVVQEGRQLNEVLADYLAQVYPKQ